jgi:hypothetical protein
MSGNGRARLIGENTEDPAWEHARNQYEGQCRALFHRAHYMRARAEEARALAASCKFSAIAREYEHSARMWEQMAEHVELLERLGAPPTKDDR